MKQKTTFNFKPSSISIWHRLYLLCLLTLVCTVAPQPLHAAPKANQNDFTLIIDPGHGGKDHGAIDNGAKEKDINLGVAAKLAALIKKRLKNVNVVMTRDDDTFISLQERANIANRNRGDLFMSIHTNSVDKTNPNRSKVAGASVYALGQQKDADNLKVAQRENAVIELEHDYKQKYSGFDPSKDESYIIFEMAQKKNLNRSLRFAEKAQKELVKAGRGDRGVRQAGFWVLWATSMPSVLVELDFICNPKSASYLNSSKGQEELAEALYKAVEGYVKTNGNRVTGDSGVSNQPAQVAKAAEKATPRVSEVEAVSISETPGQEAATETVIAQVASPEIKPAKEHNAETRTNRGSMSGPRKRRSSASRQVSDQRNLETDPILVKNEAEYLSRTQLTSGAEEESNIMPEVKEDPDKNKKGKKNKKQKKEKKPQSKPAKNSQTVRNTKAVESVSKKGRKTITVKNTGITPDSPVTGGSQKRASAEVESKSRAESRQKVAKTEESKPTVFRTRNGATPSKSVYTIVLLTSDKEVAPDDARFSGLVPTGMFVENGLYKYTFGRSESRSEIEQLLLDVRSTLPEAVIVVRRE